MPGHTPRLPRRGSDGWGRCSSLCAHYCRTQSHGYGMLVLLDRQTMSQLTHSSVSIHLGHTRDAEPAAWMACAP